MNRNLFYVGIGIVALALVVAWRLHGRTAVPHAVPIATSGAVIGAESGLHLNDLHPFYVPREYKFEPPTLPAPPSRPVVLPPCPAPMCVDTNGEAWAIPEPGTIPGRVEIDPVTKIPVGLKPEDQHIDVPPGFTVTVTTPPGPQ